MMRNYGKYNNELLMWVSNCLEYQDLGAFLYGELTESKRDVFRRFLQTEVGEMDRERVRVKNHNLRNAKPEDLEAVKAESFKFQDQIDYEFILSEWKKLDAKKESRSTQSKTNGKDGGKAKGEKAYQHFKDWVLASKFNVNEYADVSRDNFLTVVMDKGYPKKIDSKTAAGYRKKILLDKAGK